MSKTTNHLEDIISLTETTINAIKNGGNEREELKRYAKGLDSNLTKIVKAVGGEPYFFDGNNYVAWELAMDDVT